MVREVCFAMPGIYSIQCMYTDMVLHLESSKSHRDRTSWSSRKICHQLFHTASQVSCTWCWRKCLPARAACTILLWAKSIWLGAAPLALPPKLIEDYIGKPCVEPPKTLRTCFFIRHYSSWLPLLRFCQSLITETWFRSVLWAPWTGIPHWQEVLWEFKDMLK